jgi:hypothetical protein
MLNKVKTAEYVLIGDGNHPGIFYLCPPSNVANHIQWMANEGFDPYRVVIDSDLVSDDAVFFKIGDSYAKT